MALFVRNGGSRHTGQAAPPQRNIQYEADSDNTDYIYFEQDGFVVTMANWLKGRLSMDEVEQLKCEIVIPSQVNSSR